MGILDTASKQLLVESMRKVLGTRLANNKNLSEAAQYKGVEFIFENATYEQLLNLAFNPKRETKYLPSHILEQASVLLFEASMSGRQVIGINAITEAAIKVVQKTDAVISESAMDAALNAAQSKTAWQVLGEGKIKDAVAAAKEKGKAMIAKAKAVVKANPKKTAGVAAATTAAALLVKKAIDKKAADKKAAAPTVKKEGVAVVKEMSTDKTHAARQRQLDTAFDAKKGIVTKTKEAVGGAAKGAAKLVAKHPVVAGAAGIAGATAVGGGIYAAKKWREKKQKEAAAAKTA